MTLIEVREKLTRLGETIEREDVIPYGVQLRLDSGGIVNFWHTTRKITCQGKNPDQLRKRLFSAEGGGKHKVQVCTKAYPVLTAASHPSMREDGICPHCGLVIDKKEKREVKEARASQKDAPPAARVCDGRQFDGRVDGERASDTGTSDSSGVVDTGNDVPWRM